MKNRILNFAIIALSAVGLLKLADYLDQHVKSHAIQSERSVASNGGACVKREKPTKITVNCETSEKA